jgi:hypothetical protein
VCWGTESIAAVGKYVYRGYSTYIVATEDTNDLAVAVKLAEDPLLHVLQKKRVVSRGPRTKSTPLLEKGTHLLQFWLSLRHLGRCGLVFGGLTGFERS